MNRSKRPSQSAAHDGFQLEAKQQKTEGQHFEPRSYQVAIYKVAIQRNTIAVLDTGSGKTMIAVMLIKHFGKESENRGDQRRIVFLAPKVSLVMQQYEEIKLHTDLNVQFYIGRKGVDNWTIACWQKEVSDYQVMVMTPQVLLDALRQAFLNLNMFCLMIFDECHHACKNHAYSRLMKEFFHKSVLKPHVFGMTASPVIKKGVSSVQECEDQLSLLEATLDSKIFTVADRSEIDVFVPSAKEVTRYYDPKLCMHEDLKEKLGLLLEKYETSVVQLRNSMHNYEDTDNIIEASKKNLSSYYTKICHCMDVLGLACAIEAAKVCTDAVNAGEGSNFVLQTLDHCKSFLKEVLHEFEERLPEDSEPSLRNENDCLEAMRRGYISPKLYELLQIFRTFDVSSQILCLVFVERIITAKVVERFMRKVSYLSHFAVSYLAGGNSSADGLNPNMQKKTLDLFRSGKVNLLFTTDVAEEGIHVANCSCVIRFDLPKTVRSYVQSRGRARQAGSNYVIMIERGNSQQKNMLFNIFRSEQTMIDTSLNRDQESLVPKVSIEEEADAYYVDSTGASVTACSSVNLINRYCQNLPREKYYCPKPKFELDQYGGCTLILPPTAAIQRITGPLNQNSHVAKNLVCLEACKRLHQLGALDDHLLPRFENPLKDVSIEKKGESTEGAGTTKRKELHGTTPVHAMSGTWAHQNNGITLQGYNLKFLCNKTDQKYSAFILLIDATLDEDVAIMEMDLNLLDKMVKAYIRPCGQVTLDKDQVVQGKHFQELFFNGLFGKLYTKSQSSGAPREFLLKDGRSLWNTSNMYLLLPLGSSCAHEHDTISINWGAICATVAAVQYMKDIKKCPVVNSACGSSEVPSSVTEMICLANSYANPHSLKNMVVLAIHTGMIYSVLDVVVRLTADSPFDGNSEKSQPEFHTFSEYFNKKYGIVFQHPGQPLLLLKCTHNPHNLLSFKSETEGNFASKRSNGKPQNHVHMPPELLIHVDVPLEVLKSFYLLPSLMYRIKSLMLACQLRKEISFSSSKSVSSFLILEAITTQRCCEDFSLERLEHLGDSILKFAVSCNLFLKYPEKHEGQLSSHRKKLIGNATLHSLGIERGIQGYIRDTPFDPRRWTAPGHISLHPVPCECGLDDDEVLYKVTCADSDKSIVIGKTCDKGHRWICSKTVSDCVEALVGAYYVGGGLPGAIACLKWLGIDTTVESEMVEEAIRIASLRTYLPKSNEIEALESKIGYEFTVKGLLLEAITHASEVESGFSFCYQRLEFLGDSVLDLLITWHLFQCYKDIDPGELTNLRSASVNNNNFAQVAVKHKLQEHLQHASELLLEQIAEYVVRLENSPEDEYFLLLNGSSKAPKVLGDIVESIAGAILIDTKLDLNIVRENFLPLLSPIVTPDNLELPPFRELMELCSYHGYFFNSSCLDDGNMMVAILEVQLEDVLLTRKGRDKTKKTARGQAAFLLLKDLEERGILHSRYAKEKRGGEKNTIISMNKTCSSVMDMAIPMLWEHTEGDKPKDVSDDPIHLSVKMQKGGPRLALYELCKKCKWSMPSFRSTQCKPSDKVSPQIFVSSITLQIPNSTFIELEGDKQHDKKSSQDSAALAMLYELERQGRCQIAVQ